MRGGRVRDGPGNECCVGPKHLANSALIMSPCFRRPIPHGEACLVQAGL
jgi:hypothetical protein